jgi:cysteinyl-tRNA synthetase
VTIELYNTLHRRKEAFEPIDPANVRMYVCGPTVYDYAHIGNARPVVVFDVLYRLLRLEYGADHVKYVRNFTDIDDKINAAAKERGEPITAITARTIAAYHADMDQLGALRPNAEPRATEHVGEMIAMTETLIAKGHAYEADGHVLFNVPSDPNYGSLSGRNRDEMIAGARVEVAPYKRDPADFVLWKPSTEDQPGWDSPWGFGRPGWHIECSAMGEKELGVTFDIHGGGRDLTFPHHENEVAQSACAHDGAPIARYWVHNGFVTVEGEKMAKSAGNFTTVHDLLDDWPGEAIRLNLLSGHYRQPLDWTADGLRQSKTNLDRLYNTLRTLSDVEVEEGKPDTDFLAAVEDDLNTPKALSVLYALAGDANKAEDDTEKARLKSVLLACGAVIGLLEQDPEAWFQAGGTGPDATEIEDLIARRLAARKSKDYAEADRIRDALAAQGVVLEDGPEGTTWRRAG